MVVDEIQEIIDAYDVLVKGINQTALNNVEGRAYGGIIRAGKGELVESIAKTLIGIAWKRLKQPENRLVVRRKEVTIKIKDEYIKKLKNEQIKNYITQNLGRYVYQYNPDVSVWVDGKFVIAIECKAYTENAMLKRILVDFTLIKQLSPNIVPVLFQLESQLGGDYSTLNTITYGSPSTHTILSNFGIDLNIVTLLKGDRRVDRPIHKKEFYKPLTRESLENAINIFKGILKEFI